MHLDFNEAFLIVPKLKLTTFEMIDKAVFDVEYS